MVQQLQQVQQKIQQQIKRQQQKEKWIERELEQRIAREERRLQKGNPKSKSRLRRLLRHQTHLQKQSHSYHGKLRRMFQPDQQQKDEEQLLNIKHHIEQELEIEGHQEHVEYYKTAKNMVQFRIKKGVIAVLKEDKVIIFKTPVSELMDILSSEIKSVKMSSIKEERCSFCKKCKEWQRLTKHTLKCFSCGKHLKNRTRFTAESVESWDENLFEVRNAKRDMEITQELEKSKDGKMYITHGKTGKRTEICSKLRKTSKRISNTEMTPRMIGISSVEPKARPHTETLLIPIGDDINQVTIKYEKALSLIFAAKITVNGETFDGIEHADRIKQHVENIESPYAENDKVFVEESKQFSDEVVPKETQSTDNLWDENRMVKSRRVSKRKKKKAKTRGIKSERKYSQRTIKPQAIFEGSLTVPLENQRKYIPKTIET